MLTTQPRSKENKNGPRTSLMGPGGVVWGENRIQKSCETVPLSIASTDTTYIPYFVLLDSPLYLFTRKER